MAVTTVAAMILELTALAADLQRNQNISVAEARRMLISRMDLADQRFEDMMAKRNIPPEEQKLRTAGNADPEVMVDQQGNNVGTIHTGSQPPNADDNPAETYPAIPQPSTPSDDVPDDERPNVGVEPTKGEGKAAAKPAPKK